MKIGTKIILAVVCSIVLASGVGIILQRSIIEKQGIELTKQKMRAVMIEAEDVRNSVSKLGERKAFDYKRLKEELAQVKDYRDSTLYLTIPVIAGINALSSVAESENMHFRVVRTSPRNEEHAPSDYESDILRRFEQQGETEFFEIDKEKGKIIYARPIYLTQDCLSCHGNPTNSPTKDGKDILGFQMEDWRAGEPHGAYILSSDLEGIKGVVNAGMKNFIYWTIPVILVICVAFFFLIRASVINPLRGAINSTHESAEKTKETSKGINSASQSLTDGASKQAASIEETSASLEEISSSTRICSDNAKKASKLADEAKENASRGNKSMEEMVDAMKDIQESSNEVSQVIKTIEEIAFQTNILSINASVEAARVGEAGAGFATVADEVRNLAQRASKAAQETSELIKNSNKKSEEGAQVCTRVSKDLGGIVKNIDELSHLVKEVDISSAEQSQGIEQINEAISQIDQIAQNSVLNAEQTANSVVELDEQAQNLKDSVNDLYKVING